MKVKIKYCIPVAYFIYGEKEIETDSESFDKISFNEKIKIMEKIAEDEGEIPISVASALETGYAYFREI